MISIILPVLNEVGLIPQALSSLQSLRAAGHEVIVVDGGSRDASVRLSRALADKVIESARGRSAQMNVGARSARGDILLFLHADTFLPEGADQIIIDKINGGKKLWGRFDVQLSGRHPLLRVVERLMNLRSRLSGIATGDQAIFVRREIFEAIGGFPDIELMEDIALSTALKKYGRPFCIKVPVCTSSRRWEEKGIVRTILLMCFLRLAYFCNMDPGRLAKLYYPRAKDKAIGLPRHGFCKSPCTRRG